MTIAPPPEPALSRAERSAIIRDGIAVGVATGAYGVSFGAIAVAAGLTIVQTCALSLLVFTGATQFALVGVVASGGAPLSGMVTGLLLGTRNTLYGLRVAPLLDWLGWRRAAAAHFLIDETTAMSVNRETRAAARVGFLSSSPASHSLSSTRGWPGLRRPWSRCSSARRSSRWCSSPQPPPRWSASCNAGLRTVHQQHTAGKPSTALGKQGGLR